MSFIMSRKKNQVVSSKQKNQVDHSHLQQVLAAMPTGVILLDADYCVLMANPVARQLLPIADGEVLTHLGTLSLDETLIKRRETFDFSLPQPVPRIFEVHVQPIEQAQERQWLLTLREVTQERECQQQLQMLERLATMGQLATGVAHDLNNIMATIILLAQLQLKSANSEAGASERLNTIVRQGHRAGTLIKQILDFSRHSGMERQRLDLVPFLKELSRLLERTLPENIRLKLAYDHDDYVVYVDPTRLQQLFMNLAVNARDAMPSGGTICLELFRFQQHSSSSSDIPPGDWVQVTIKDNGIGIAPDVLPHIFEPFYTTKAPGQGTGLGLAQAYGIIVQHEGHITVESQVGHGTTFTIYLPALTSSTEESATLEQKPTPMGKGEVILLVEDDDSARITIQEILELLNYQVLLAENGREALDLFTWHEHEVALVLSDLMMPDLRGEELFAALKAKDSSVKMIAMTGYPLSKQSQALLEEGRVEWIVKPFSIQQLAQTVRSALHETALGRYE